MNKKIKKLKNRILQTMQGNYSIEYSPIKNKSSSNQKFRTLNAEKLSHININSSQNGSKRVYINDLKQSLGVEQKKLDKNQKEEYLQNKKIQTREGYFPRTKSSNGMPNNRSLRQSSKLSKIHQKINIQFQNELYWNNNNSYLVTGVKNQYQKMKKNYQQKCEQLQKVRKEYKLDRIKQLQIYIQKLERQNIRLVEVLKKKRNTSESSQKQANSRQSAVKLVMERYQSEESELNSAQNLQRIQKLQKKNRTLSQRLSLLQKQNANLTKRIHFLDKLIIEKQNNQFKAVTKCKKLQKFQSQIKFQLKQAQVKSQTQLRNQQIQINSLKSKLYTQYEAQKRQLSQQIRNKNQKIQRMEKEIYHLKNLLEYWKSNEGNSHFDEDKLTQKQKYEMQIPFYHTTNISLQLQTDRIKLNKQTNKLKIKNSIQNDINHLSNRNMLSQRSLKSQFKNKNNLNQNQTLTQKNVKRQRTTAKTQKQNSIKCRPVETNQIQPILQYIKLKLAYKNISPSTVKKYFQKKKVQKLNAQLKTFSNHQTNQEDNSHSTDKQRETIQYQIVHSYITWNQEYITLKEVYDVLLNQPFLLKESQALLLGRFIIEDVKQPYIYMNWDSQISRRIVQSISTNLIGNYKLLDQINRLKSQQLLKKFQSNIIPAIKSISGKSTKITQQKFFQILNGLGLQRTKQMDNYILGKMCCSSLNLQELQFNSLYSKVNDS